MNHILKFENGFNAGDFTFSSVTIFVSFLFILNGIVLVLNTSSQLYHSLKVFLS